MQLMRDIPTLRKKEPLYMLLSTVFFVIFVVAYIDVYEISRESLWEMKGE